jgi:CelD/BcsL family acetyltransferase involved in cellulose biosynthesis
MSAVSISIRTQSASPLRAISLEDALTSAVDEYVQTAPGATVFHTPAWNRIVRDVFGTDFSYVVAQDNGRVVGVMPIHWIAGRQRMGAYYSPPRALEVPYAGPVANESAIACSLIRQVGCERLGARIEVCSPPGASAWVKPQAWWYVLPLETVRVDLRAGLTGAWSKSLDGKRRNMIRKAERSGVELRTGGAELADVYYDLVRDMTARAGISLMPGMYYRRVLETFQPRGAARLVLAYVENRPVAGGVFLRHGQTAYYWHGATSSDAPNLGQGELIQWDAIRWASESGCSWYDLVGVERERLPRIAQFKLGFSRDAEPFYHVVHAPLVNRVVARVLAATSGRG